jgi:hypothetical protein
MMQEMTKDNRINTESIDELKFWAVQLHVTIDELLETIKELRTNRVSKVEEHIQYVKY